MLKITAENAFLDSDGVWMTESSTLGVRLGNSPDRLPTDLGNGSPFIFTRATHSVGGTFTARAELIATYYAQAGSGLVPGSI